MHCRENTSVVNTLSKQVEDACQPNEPAKMRAALDSVAKHHAEMKRIRSLCLGGKIRAHDRRREDRAALTNIFLERKSSNATRSLVSRRITPALYPTWKPLGPACGLRTRAAGVGPVEVFWRWRVPAASSAQTSSERIEPYTAGPRSSPHCRASILPFSESCALSAVENGR
jgi:hypothetical protein